MRLLIVSLVLMLGSAQAQAVLTGVGCFWENGVSYVANGVAYCSNAPINCYKESNDNLLAYGGSIGQLCDKFYQSVTIGLSESQRANINYEALIYQTALAKRMKKVCGAKCKRVK